MIQSLLVPAFYVGVGEVAQFDPGLTITSSVVLQYLKFMWSEECTKSDGSTTADLLLWVQKRISVKPYHLSQKFGLLVDTIGLCQISSFSSDFEMNSYWTPLVYHFTILSASLLTPVILKGQMPCRVDELCDGYAEWWCIGIILLSATPGY